LDVEPKPKERFEENLEEIVDKSPLRKPQSFLDVKIFKIN
jgi:hypothetical protein